MGTYVGTTSTNEKTGTTFSTFTAAGIVRRGLQAEGFEVEKVKGFGNKREMLRGVLINKEENSLIKNAIKKAECKNLPPWFDLPTLTYKEKSRSQLNGRRHAVVVGAGIAGITTACALAKRGWSVEIIDSNEAIAQGGSGNPQGIVLPRVSMGESAESAFYDVAFLKTLRELARLKQHSLNLPGNRVVYCNWVVLSGLKNK